MANVITIDDLMQRMSTRQSAPCILDVRSPGEFAQGHVPGATNLPLFSDEERSEVGTLYRQEGRQSAVLRGLELVGPKMRWLVEQSAEIAGRRESLVVHCWRGGQRSQSVAWLLERGGLRPDVLEGGYKQYRRAANRAFSAQRKIIVLSGMTGAGKTRWLHALSRAGEQILDLEALAHHRGSSFGALGLAPQPTCEQFENDVFEVLRTSDPHRPVWIEDESPSIGRVRVPEALWAAMRLSPAIFLDVSRARRARHLADEYGVLNRDGLADAIRRLERRLGGLRTRQALNALAAGEMEEVAHDLLGYYDKTYQHAATRRPRKHVLTLQDPKSVQELLALTPHCMEVVGA